jgi:hypothetical protein
MVRQALDTPRSWYDEIARRQYYDELIPAYEGLQDQMAGGGSAFMACARGLAALFNGLLGLARRRGRSVQSGPQVSTAQKPTTSPVA